LVSHLLCGERPNCFLGIYYTIFRTFSRTFAFDGDTEFVIANGEPFIREELYEKIKAGGFRLAKLIDRTATISRSAMISEGNIISSGCFVSSDAILGKNVYMQSSSVVAHDATVGDNSVISSFCQVSGSCKIANNVYVGIGSMIREKIKIDTGSIIGMGSFVHKDVPEYMITMGNPARIIARNETKRVFKKSF